VVIPASSETCCLYSRHYMFKRKRPTDRLLKESGVRYLTHRWLPTPDFLDLLARERIDRGVKTLALETSNRMVLVALRATDDLDYGKLATTLGVDHVSAAAPGRVREVLGVEPGFETILTHADLTRFLDERVLSLNKAFLSGGVDDRLYELTPADLLKASGATVADLALERAT
jgi:prolyl-tRNA editing enzyme YbaK/EbsC (Cys-tRNA(Pro) deacylase)